MMTEDEYFELDKLEQMKGEIKMINAKEAYDLSAPNLDTYRSFI